MSESSIFAAIPGDIAQGAGNTNEVAEYAESLFNSYDEATRWDPNDPPWGIEGDVSNAFHEQYVEAQAQLRDAVQELARAITSAGVQTLNSSKRFAGAQNDATTVIHNEGGGGRR